MNSHAYLQEIYSCMKKVTERLERNNELLEAQTRAMMSLEQTMKKVIRDQDSSYETADGSLS